MASGSFALKLIIDREKNRVAWIETDGEFVDILFSLLASPIGNVIRLLKDTKIGSMHKLYYSVENMETRHLQTEECKYMLLHPRRVNEWRYRNLALNVGDTDPRSTYVCQSWSCPTQTSHTYSYIKGTRCTCGLVMDTQVYGQETEPGKNSVFVVTGSLFLVCDDLHIFPFSLANMVAILKSLKIQDRSILEERIVPFGKEELLNLLGRSLVSQTPFTDVLLRKPLQSHATKELKLIGGNEDNVGNWTYVVFPSTVAKLLGGKGVDSMLFGGVEHVKTVTKLLESKGMDTTLSVRGGKHLSNLLFRHLNFATGSKAKFTSIFSSICSKMNRGSKKVKVKLTASKSNNEVVFAEAGNDFVDILFSFLTFPFGSIVELLDKDSSLGCIYNLYQSVKELSDTNNFVGSKTCKGLLLSPRLAAHHGCSNQILKINEVASRGTWTYRCYTCFATAKTSPDSPSKCAHGIEPMILKEINPKLDKPGTACGGGFVKRTERFMVTKNMEVAPLSSISTLDFLDKLKGPIEKFEEREAELGEREVLELLKGCLSSHTPLSDAFSCLFPHGRGA